MKTMDPIKGQKEKIKDLIILGINDSHDASACIIRNGKVLCCISEESLQRIKGMGGFPGHSIEQCLKQTGLKRSDIDYVAVAGKKCVPVNLLNMTGTLSRKDFLRLQYEKRHPEFYENRHVPLKELFPDYRPEGNVFYSTEKLPFAESKELSNEELAACSRYRHEFIASFLEIPKEKVLFIDHHRAHAYYGYFSDPDRKESVTVITADAGGDGVYESVSSFTPQGVKVLSKDNTNLIGKIYRYITLFLSMTPHFHEYKVMGLAPYAHDHNKKYAREVFGNCLRVEGLKFKRNPEMKDFFFYLKEKLQAERFDDIAGGLQDFTEDLSIEWIKNAIRQTGFSDISLSGGLALNIKMSKKLLEQDEVSSLFVPAGPGDTSLSIGAVWCLMEDLSDYQSACEIIQPLHHAYLGTTFGKEEVQAFLQSPEIRNNYTVYQDRPLERLAQTLSNNGIGMLIQGEAEFGPRALGHRSIVANPSRYESVEEINRRLKRRDFWMPFTPSILDRRMKDYIINEKGANCSYMTLAFDTTPIAKDHLKGAIHPYDKTARPQSVKKEINPAYYELIENFEKLTGVGAVLNTSLNIHGKPIVRSPVDILEEIIPHMGHVVDGYYIDGHFLEKNSKS